MFFKNEDGHITINYTSIIIVLLALLVIIGLFGTIYRVKPGYNAVLYRLGAIQGIQESGWHLKVPFIDDVEKEDVETVRRFEYGYRTDQEKSKDGKYVYTENEDTTAESKMLTSDLKIVNVDYVVQFKIADPAKYLINLPEKKESKTETIRNIQETCFRQVVAESKLDDVLTTGKEDIQRKAKENMHTLFNNLNFGINVIAVQIQDVDLPTNKNEEYDVQRAFNAVNSAKANKDRRILEATEILNKKTAEAEGEYQKIINDAETYKASLINIVDGEVSRVNKLAPMYAKNPELVKKTLYLESAEVFMKNLKIVFVENGISVSQIDKLIKGDN